MPEPERKITSYYYYGKVSEQLYKKISRNEVATGFIRLEAVKYWDADDHIQNYSDIERQGDIVFRIEDVRRISPVNIEPKVGMGVEQFAEKSNAANGNAVKANAANVAKAVNAKESSAKAANAKAP